jgi:hypothetical protein
MINKQAAEHLRKADEDIEEALRKYKEERAEEMERLRQS